MAGINSPQRGAIASVVGIHLSRFSIPARPARLGKIEVFPWGVSRDWKGKGGNSSNVLVMGLVPKPNLKVEELPFSSFAVLMRPATIEEYQGGWTCKGNLVTLELLEPVECNDENLTFLPTGRKASYAEQEEA